MASGLDYFVQSDASSSSVLGPKELAFQDTSAEKFAEQLTLMDAVSNFSTVGIFQFLF